MQQYLDDIGKNKLLRKEREYYLSAAIMRNDAASQAALDELVTANLRLVVSIAKRYTRSNMGKDDIVQEGNLGLIRAAKKYDHAMGFRFSTYATGWIKSFIERAIMDKDKTIRVPVNVEKDRRQIEKAANQLKIEGVICPSDDQIIKLACITSRRYQKATGIIKTVSATSLGDFDKQSIEQDSTVDYSHRVESDLMSKSLHSAVANLDQRSQNVINMRFYRQLTYKQTGDIIGTSLETVRTIERKALKRIKEFVN